MGADFYITCQACPTQAEGRTVDGRAFYFRYRWGCWTLSVSEPGGSVNDAVDALFDPHGAKVVAEGEVGMELDGFMPRDEVWAIVSQYLEVAGA